MVGSNYLYAQHVSETDAIRIAQYFCGNDEENSCSEKRAEYRVLAIGGQSPTMYKISYPQGWVIVSADQRVCPILAYSNAGITGVAEKYTTFSQNQQYRILKFWKR